MHRKHFSILAALAASILAGGMVTASAAHAATPSCGISCVDIFSDQFGDAATGHPAFLMDSYKQGAATGTPLILFRESNSDPAQDFVFENQGTVADFYAAGLVSASTAMHYGCKPGINFPDCFPHSPVGFNLAAYEIEYSPLGAPTGQCVGIAAAPTPGEKVTLQPCGVSAKTVWIVDLVDGYLGKNPFGDGDVLSPLPHAPAVPLINGANTNFSHPFVMTYPANGYPADMPRPVINVTNLTGHFTGVFPFNSTITADVNSDQLWDADLGTVQT